MFIPRRGPAKILHRRRPRQRGGCLNRRGDSNAALRTSQQYPLFCEGRAERRRGARQRVRPKSGNDTKRSFPFQVVAVTAWLSSDPSYQRSEARPTPRRQCAPAWARRLRSRQRILRGVFRELRRSNDRRGKTNRGPWLKQRIAEFLSGENAASGALICSRGSWDCAAISASVFCWRPAHCFAVRRFQPGTG